MRGLVMAAGVMLMAGVPAAAQDRTGYTAIAAGDFVQAETTLMRERAIFPGRPELMLNLAAVYARTGRVAQARSLYADVLEREAVALELSNGATASSHALALTGLSRLDTIIAAR